MGNTLLLPDQVDRLYRLPHGRALRLARKGLLPSYKFPDGTIRFDPNELEAFLKKNPEGNQAGGEGGAA